MNKDRRAEFHQSLLVTAFCVAAMLFLLALAAVAHGGEPSPAARARVAAALALDPPADDDIVIVLLCSPNCPPCRAMEKMLEDHADGLPRHEVRLDSVPANYPRPCVVLYRRTPKGFFECCRHYGAVSYEQLRSMIGDCKAGRASVAKGVCACPDSCGCKDWGCHCADGVHSATCTCKPGDCPAADGRPDMSSIPGQWLPTGDAGRMGFAAGWAGAGGLIRNPAAYVPQYQPMQFAPPMMGGGFGGGFRGGFGGGCSS